MVASTKDPEICLKEGVNGNAEFSDEMKNYSTKINFHSPSLLPEIPRNSLPIENYHRFTAWDMRALHGGGCMLIRLT